MSLGPPPPQPPPNHQPPTPHLPAQYAEMEMRHRFINHARNVWDRAVTLLPRIDQLWYKYIHMEEMLGNVAGTRQVLERWMRFEPDHAGWMAYIKVGGGGGGACIMGWRGGTAGRRDGGEGGGGRGACIRGGGPKGGAYIKVEWAKGGGEGGAYIQWRGGGCKVEGGLHQ